MDKISKAFAESVRQKLKKHIKQIILFGSHARGDFTESSDYDILIIVDNKEKEIQNTILDICVEFMNKYYALIGYVIYGEEEWQKKKNYPLGLNILKEGIKL
ncbi:nucleotidyltransferase domain-containing protein [Candidatus Desantisbacteria bacterium]|nr:nucleotidyltransferase domain-containing protein [Candidatus Desantisbacteria bacterium]